MAPQYTDVLYELRGDAAWVTINRPKLMNALRGQTLAELGTAMRRADGERVACVVLTGAGERAFCAGGDVAEMRDLDPARGRGFLKTFVDTVQVIRGLSKPVLCRVDGYCIGGGNELNVACDLTIASDRSSFGQVGPTVGSVPVIGATQTLPRIVGEKRAREIVFLCQRYPAEEALRLGLVNRVVPAAELDRAVDEWVARLGAMSPQALRIAKVSLNHAGDALLPSLTAGIEMLAA